MLAGRRDPSRRVAIGRGSSRAHFLAIIFLAIGFLDSFRFLDRKKSMQLCFSIADRHFFLVGPEGRLIATKHVLQFLQQDHGRIAMIAAGSR